MKIKTKKDLEKSKEVKTIINKQITKSVEQKISREDYLEIKLNHLEREKLMTEVQNVALQVESIDRQKIILNLTKDDLRNKLKKIEIRHKDLLDEIRVRTGVTILGKTINPETLEVE